MCAATRQPFKPGDHFVATLVESPAGLARVDYSLPAWESGARPGSPAFGVWRSVFQPHAPEKKRLFDDDEVLDIFESLASASDERQVRFRYVLTLLLARRRLLRIIERKSRNGVTVLTVKRRGEADLPAIEVTAPDLTEEALADCMEQLGRVIDEGGQAPGGAG